MKGSSKTVRVTLKRMRRSETLKLKPEREYLLKGIIRCAYCGMRCGPNLLRRPAGTTGSTGHPGARVSVLLPAASVTCHIVDDQMGHLVQAIELGPGGWRKSFHHKSQGRGGTGLKMPGWLSMRNYGEWRRPMVDGVFPDEEYHRQKKLLELELESLVVPKANAAKRP